MRRTIRILLALGLALALGPTPASYSQSPSPAPGPTSPPEEVVHFGKNGSFRVPSGITRDRGNDLHKNQPIKQKKEAEPIYSGYVLDSQSRDTCLTVFALHFPFSRILFFPLKWTLNRSRKHDGKELKQKMTEMMRGTYPDAVVEVMDVTPQGDYFRMHMRFRGTIEGIMQRGTMTSYIHPTEVNVLFSQYHLSVSPQWQEPVAKMHRTFKYD